MIIVFITFGMNMAPMAWRVIVQATIYCGFNKQCLLTMGIFLTCWTAANSIWQLPCHFKLSPPKWGWTSHHHTYHA